MATNPGANFRDKASGNPAYTDGSSRQMLSFALNPSLTSEPTQTERRAVALAQAKSAVDALSQWGEIGREAEAAIAEADTDATLISSQFNSLYPDAYSAWHTDYLETIAGRQLTITGRVQQLLAAARAAFPGTAMPFPATSPDVGALNVRLEIFDHATPEDGRTMVQDAVRRDDKPFLWAVGSNLRAWLGRRNSWSSGEAQRIAAELLDAIDEATWTVESAQATYCSTRADAFWGNWRYIMNQTRDGQRLDAAHRQAGALSPMFEPIPKASVVSPNLLDISSLE